MPRERKNTGIKNKLQDKTNKRTLAELIEKKKFTNHCIQAGI